MEIVASLSFLSLIYFFYFFNFFIFFLMPSNASRAHREDATILGHVLLKILGESGDKIDCAPADH